MTIIAEKASPRPTSTPRQIWDMHYPDFVAFIDQENAPPGGADTLAWWATAAGMTKNSRLLDLACSTGFSSRRLVQRLGCNAVGLDVSRPAIEAAEARAVTHELVGKLSYVVGNAEAQPFVANRFTHVVAGCCFGFFGDKRAALAECARVLEPGGRLCLSTFAYVATPPPELLSRVSACVGYIPDARRTERYWREFFSSRFELESESRWDLPVYCQEQICSAATSYLIGIRHRFDALDDLTLDAVVKRLVRDRLIFNEHRKYQSCTRYVWRLPPHE